MLSFYKFNQYLNYMVDFKMPAYANIPNNKHAGYTVFSFTAKTNYFYGFLFLVSD